ncbi:MAG: GNAT family N-acetyltransferase, partial [Nocardioides sp.]
MALAHHGLDAASLWLHADDGFALLRGGGLDIAVSPDARGAGVGTALARAALEVAPNDVTAWSHRDDPAAAAIAARLGFTAVRRLWVMRRDAAP